jgi:CRP-like cAMP-binding protein
MKKNPSHDGSQQFSGREGKRRLLEALKSQTLISGNAELARAIAKIGILQHHPIGAELMQQGSPDNDIILIVAGEVAIKVNDRQVASRASGTHVGEMALVDHMAKRSATVSALEASVTLRIPEHRFSKIAALYPDLWRRIAVEIAKRLRERNKLLRQPHNEPVLFIGSSTEGLPITNEIHKNLAQKPIVPKLWSESNGVLRFWSCAASMLTSPPLQDRSISYKIFYRVVHFSWINLNRTHCATPDFSASIYASISLRSIRRRLPNLANGILRLQIKFLMNQTVALA